jgi:predicted nucleotidyltransferase
MTAEAVKKDPILTEMVRRLVEALEPQQIYLFGSRARGDAGPDSDYDLLVIVTSSDIPGYKRAMNAFKTLYGLGVAKDVVVLTREEFDSRLDVVCSLPATVKREGLSLYAA